MLKLAIKETPKVLQPMKSVLSTMLSMEGGKLEKRPYGWHTPGVPPRYFLDIVTTVSDKELSCSIVHGADGEVYVVEVWYQGPFALLCAPLRWINPVHRELVAKEHADKGIDMSQAIDEVDYRDMRSLTGMAREVRKLLQAIQGQDAT